MYTAAEILPLWKAKLPDLPADVHQALAEALAEFSVEVAEREREACAKIADSYELGYGKGCAAEIRARKIT